MEIQNRAGESRILLVEDDKEIREGIEIFLRGQGYRVFQAADGVEGLEILEREEIHLAIVDIMMPRMDGVTMVIRLREHYDFPVIFLSAKSEEVDKIMGLNMGADDYITKPFTPMELLARVNSHLRRYNRFMLPAAKTGATAHWSSSSDPAPSASDSESERPHTFRSHTPGAVPGIPSSPPGKRRVPHRGSC